MAIKQERVEKIIAAGLDFQRGFERALEIIQHESALAREGSSSFEQGLQNVELLVGQHLLGQPLESRMTLELESQHFNRVRGRNRASAKWAARKRAERANGGQGNAEGE